MDLLKQLHHSEVLQPHTMKPWCYSTASAVGHNQVLPVLETANTGVRAARQNAGICRPCSWPYLKPGAIWYTCEWKVSPKTHASLFQ